MYEISNLDFLNAVYLKVISKIDRLISIHGDKSKYKEFEEIKSHIGEVFSLISVESNSPELISSYNY